MNYDVIVAGCGGVGSAAVHALAARGAKVIGIDRFTPPHDQGSTHGNTRVIRMAYFEHPDYVPLLKRSYQLWAELEAACGLQLYFERGLLEVGPPDGQVVPGVLEAARRHQLEVEALNAAEVRRRFPRFVVPDELTAVFERRAGYLLVERCVAAYIACAQRAGAQFGFGERLLDWQQDGAGVAVLTDRRLLRASRLILAPGAWAPELLADLFVPLEVRRKVLLWYAAQPDPRWPVYLFELPSGVFYGFPALPGEGAKIAEHTGGERVDDPRRVDRNLRPEDRTQVERFLAAHLRNLRGPPIQHAVCLYTMSPDQNFILDRHPRSPRVLACCGLSGHGFKLVPALGEVLAGLALDDRLPPEATFLGVSRFAKSS